MFGYLAYEAASRRLSAAPAPYMAMSFIENQS